MRRACAAAWTQQSTSRQRSVTAVPVSIGYTPHAACVIASGGGQAPGLPVIPVFALNRQKRPDGDGYLDADAPWSDMHGKPLAERGLASMLKRYDIHPQKMKVDGRALQGYRREHLHDAWQRYLPPSPKEAEPPEPPEPGDRRVPQVPQVPDAMGSVSLEVRCEGCANFDRDASLCMRFSRPVDPGHYRICDEYSVPF